MLCKRCGFRTRDGKSPYCALCRAADPHRNHSRKKSEIIICVDCEGSQRDNIMSLLTMSYGREDGTSDSIATNDPKKALLWLFEQAGEYNGKRQSFHSFHFNFDIAVITKAFNPDKMFLIHKAGAKKNNLLCDYKNMHKPGERHDPWELPCEKIHRHDVDYINAVITSGGESDLIAYDPTTNLAISSSPKRRFYVEYRPGGDRYESRLTIDIHDHGSAFVGGLEKVIETWQPELSDAERDIIHWGKAARKIPGELESHPLKTMQYSEAECVADARCARKLIDTIRTETGILIKPSKLYGSGSIAGSAFDYHRMQTREEMEPGEWFYELAEWTYFGGLIETPIVGLVPMTIDSEDINSAYPSHAVEIPCNRAGHGYWERGKPRQIPSESYLGYVLANWGVKTPSTPPFVVHTPNKSVRAPLKGAEIWVTLPEYRAARQQFGELKVSGTDAAWWIQTCDCPNPLAWMQDLYNKRNDIKRRMKQVEYGCDEWQLLNVQQEAIKLVLNSCYGKLAQMRPEPGKYTNLHFASYITGATRAQLRIRTWHKESMGGTVVYQHTDSVKFINASLEDEGKALGKWGGEDPKQGAIILQPGMWVPLEEGKKGASRGVGAADLYASTMEWLSRVDLTVHPSKWPKVIVPTHRMVSRRMAIHRGKPEIMASFQDGTLAVGPTHGKRNLNSARQLPGTPTAWIVPPIEWEPNPASLEDLRKYRLELLKAFEEGKFDHNG